MHEDGFGNSASTVLASFQIKNNQMILCIVMHPECSLQQNVDPKHRLAEPRHPFLRLAKSKSVEQTSPRI